MVDVSTAAGLSQVIQLSIAPVFLLAGIGALLSVMTSRLARVVNRTREIEEKNQTECSQEVLDRDRKELKYLNRRIAIINRAISFCTASAILVCLLIMCLFLFSFTMFISNMAIVGMFVLSMLSLIIGLSFFQLEVYLSIKWLKLIRKFEQEKL